MSTEEIINKAFEQYLAEYKKFYMFFLAAFAILQVIFTYLMFRKMERFKSFLKKTEIKFTRYHELQVEALRNNYQKLVSFNSANNALFNSDYDTNNHTQFKNRITYWNQTFNECISQLAYDKILLPEDLINLVDKSLLGFKEVRNILKKEKEDLEYTETEGQGNWDIMYDYDDNELAVINTKINRLKSQDYIKNSDTNIRSLRRNIEIHFVKMNG